MPAKLIKADYGDDVSLEVLAKLKGKWKQSMISLLYCSGDIGVITYNQKRYFISQFNTRGIRRREPPELDVAYQKPKLMRQYIAQFRAKTGLGTSGIAAVLSLNVGDFLELYGE